MGAAVAGRRAAREERFDDLRTLGRSEQRLSPIKRGEQSADGVIVGLDVAEGVDYIWWSSQTSLPGKEYLVGVDPQAFIRASPPSPTSG